MYVGSCTEVLWRYFPHGGRYLHGGTIHINWIQWGDCMQCYAVLYSIKYCIRYYTVLYCIVLYLANAPVFLYLFIYMGWGEYGLG